MLIKEKNNRGFTLVEVIVSMLVLSITIVSVLSAFTLAAKSNTKTKKIQTAESLLEDLVEYTNAYSKEFDPEKDLATLGRYDIFGGSLEVKTAFSAPGDAVVNDVEVSEITGIIEGVHEYKVRITRDRTPDKYSGGLNDHGVITFGETGSKTVLIHADGSSDDTAMVDLYHAMHEEEVDTHNLAELALAEEDSDYTPNELTPLSKDDVAREISREIWLELKSASAEKVKLEAYMVYYVDESLLLPTGAERQMKELFFTSDEFDLNTSTLDTAEKLKQIYVLFAPPTGGIEKTTVDIRVLDRTGGQLDANIFLVYQKSGLDAIGTAITKDNLGAYYSTSEKINVAFGEPLGSPYNPTRASLYCSAYLDVIGTKPSTVTEKELTLVASNTEIRIVTVKIEVLDPDTDQVLAQTKEAIACLQ